MALVRTLPTFSTINPTFTASTDGQLVSIQSFSGSVPDVRPCITNVEWGGRWCPGINEGSSQFTPTLVLAMPLNDGSGDSNGTSTSGGWPVRDVGPNHFNGSLTGHLTGQWIYDTYFGMVFNMTAVSNYITVPTQCSIPQIVNSESVGWTMSIWFMIPPDQASIGFTYVIVGNHVPHDSGPATIQGWYLWYDPHTRELHWIDNIYAGNDFVIRIDDNPGEWIHACVVSKFTGFPSPRPQSFYINGQLIATSNSSSANAAGVLSCANQAITIGGQVATSGASASHDFVGPIRDFRLYAEPFTAGQVFELWRYPDELYSQPSLIPYFALQNFVFGICDVKCSSSITTPNCRVTHVATCAVKCNSNIGASAKVAHIDSVAVICNSSISTPNCRVSHFSGLRIVTQNAGFVQKYRKSFPTDSNNINFSYPVNSGNCLSKGLVLWYMALPQKSRSTIVYDLTTRSNNGVLTNMFAAQGDGFNVLSHRGGFGSFHFTGSRTSYILGPRTALTGTGAFTVSFWTYISISTATTLLYKTDNDVQSGWFIDYNSGGLALNITFQNNDCIRSSPVPPVNAWVHITLTWNGSSLASGIHIYYNGVEQAYQTTSDGNGTRLTDAGSPLVIGSYNQSTQNLTGYMDDIRIYNRELSRGETNLLYQNSITSYPGLINRANKYINFNTIVAPGNWTIVCNSFIGASGHVASNNNTSIICSSSIGTAGSKVAHVATCVVLNSVSLNPRAKNTIKSACAVICNSTIIAFSPGQRVGTAHLTVVSNIATPNARVAHIATTHIVCRGDCVIIEGQICRVANSSSAILNARVDHVEGGNTLQRAGFAQNASRTFPITINNTNFARQVNFKHPLAQGLTAWYLASPVTSQGLYWYDIVGKHHALFANLQQRFLGGYRPTSRKGGFGSILFFGGASQGAVGPPNELIGTGPFTVSFWIMGVSSGTVIYKTDNNASAGLYIQVNIPSLLVAVVFNGTDCTRSCAPPPFGSWTHVVVTWRGGSAASNIHVYYNGVEVSYSGATDGTGTHGSDSGQPLVIGSYNQITSFVTGYLDDVRIYNRALPANTVLASYTNSLASYPNLINRTSKPINFSFVYGPAAAPLLCVASIGAMPMVNHIATCAIRANSFIGANGFVITPFFGSGGLNFGGSAHSYPVMNFYPSGGIFFNTFPSFANAITSRNPLVWYRLDDPSGTTAVNSGSLGSAMNGTYHGDFTLNQTSLILSDPSNASVLFGGTSSYLLSPDNVAINSSTPYTQRTIELWFRTGADVVTRRTLYEEGDITRGFGIYLDSYVIVMIVWNMTADSGSPAWGFHYVFSSPILQSHQRYHAALSFHAAGHVIAGYLNGVLFGIHGGLADNVGSHDAISIGAKNNGTRYIDGPSTGSGNRFNNLIDEVIVYSDYSDPDEIAFDYHASFPSGYYIPNFVVDGSGGLMLGGTGIVNHILTWINTSGGLIFSGSSDASFQLSYIGTGGLIFSGSADADVETRIYFGTGGLIFGGQADCIVLSHSYTGTGGLIFGGGSTGGQVTYVISLPISWNVNANLSTTLVLSWSIGQGSMMFYTVETNCSTQTCPPLSDSTASCLSRQVMTIPARSLEEVCSKLKKAGIITNIASVKMYSNPVFLSDFTKTQSVNCNTLTDVTAQFFAVSDCS